MSTSDAAARHGGAAQRRQLLAAATAAAITPSLVACSASGRAESAARLVRQALPLATARPAPATPPTPELLRELVRCATLAPSSHNTQCWTFRWQDQAMHITPDMSRRCPAVDPDNHHLYVSLGCAAENLVQAASAHGLGAELHFDPAGDGAVVVRLLPATVSPSPWLQAIGQRQCSRGDYDGQPLSSAELALLQQAGAGPGVQLQLLTDRAMMAQLQDQVVAANTVQMNDAAFMAELKAWIRFSEDEAVRSADGLFAAASGNPSLPRWLGSRLMDLVMTAHAEGQRYARQIASSAGIAVFVADVADAAHWVAVGRCYQRFALQATTMGVRNAFLNQPLEVVAARQQLAASLGVAPRRPDLLLRFGRGPTLPISLRRPLQAVLRGALADQASG